MPRRTTHRDEISGGGQLFITIAMPLDLAFGFAMVVIFLRIGFLMTTIPTQRIYEGYWLSGDSRVFFVRHFGTFCNVGCRYQSKTMLKRSQEKIVCLVLGSLIRLLQN